MIAAAADAELADEAKAKAAAYLAEAGYTADGASPYNVAVVPPSPPPRREKRPAGSMNGNGDAKMATLVAGSTSTAPSSGSQDQAASTEAEAKGCPKASAVAPAASTEDMPYGKRARTSAPGRCSGPRRAVPSDGLCSIRAHINRVEQRFQVPRSQMPSRNVNVLIAPIDIAGGDRHSCGDRREPGDTSVGRRGRGLMRGVCAKAPGREGPPGGRIEASKEWPEGGPTEKQEEEEEPVVRIHGGGASRCQAGACICRRFRKIMSELEREGDDGGRERPRRGRTS